MSAIRILASAVALAVFVATFQLQPAAAATTEAGRVKNFASNQLGKPFRLGADGLRRYDCSGLVFRTFRETGLLNRIGGRERTARGYFQWAKSNGRVTSNPRPGDLVVWAYRGRPVSHIGIYIGRNSSGDAMAISALTTGVSRHRVRGISVPLKAYIRVNLSR